MDASDEPFIVDGQVIPRGVEVAVPQYALFHIAEIYPDPFLYDPERWMEPA